MSRTVGLVSILLSLLLGMSACNLPSNATPTHGADVALTSAAQTVEANMTQAAILNPPTIPPTSTLGFSTATLAIATTRVPANTAVPTQTCDVAQFIDDVTIPDGTVLEPNETFTKTWRLKNTGTCSWTTSYAIVFSSGDSLGGPATQTLTGNVNPGQSLDISVNLKAPATPGNYRGYWKLRNGSGVLFAQFYVDIKVASATPTPTATATSVPKADLKITQITYDPASPHMGDLITIKVSVYNDGDAPSGPSTAQWWPAEGYPNAECSWAVGSLVAHGGQVYTCTYTYAGWSTYKTRAVADSGNAVEESNEGNNTLEQTLVVGP